MSFQQGLSGLNAAAKNLDVIGNNVANANTVGYKVSNAVFADVFASSIAGGGGTQIGIGTSVAGVSVGFTQGNVTTTDAPLDMAINGQGFFRVENQGSIAYTRNGQFSLDKNGYVVSPSGAFLTGYTANTMGVINTSSYTNLRISTSEIPANATTQGEIVTNLDSRKTALLPAGFDMNDPGTYHSATSMSVYDSQGNPHTLSMYFMKTAANSWEVFAAGDGTQIGAGSVGTLAFNSDGTLDSTGTTFPSTVNVPATAGATANVAVELNFDGTTQFGNIFSVNQLTQDGYTSGRLSGFSVADDGVIMSSYSNGQTRAQGQVMLANFNNPNGLQPLGGSFWAETATSGQPLPGTPGSSSLGVLQSGAVEESNVDLTAELVDMITAQRVYQANAQTIKTQDQVMQTLVNMR
ncbi:MAG: flagellar hook protein FlgE [Betaproteobacteria bacterium]|jgi:flagellar hook protein FlgE|nr:flagellar hook protein FlgE [Betaproteobacteria bacterium]